MANGRIQIARYPNRRFYSRQSSQYVSLQDIEALVQAGRTSKSGIARRTKI